MIYRVLHLKLNRDYSIKYRRAREQKYNPHFTLKQYSTLYPKQNNLHIFTETESTLSISVKAQPLLASGEAQHSKWVRTDRIRR